MLAVPRRRCFSYIFIFFIALLILLWNDRYAWSRPSGLNNIITTDVVAEHTLVLQSWLNLADNQHPDQFVGFKYGLLKGAEVGIDWKARSDTHAHATFQAKYSFKLMEDIWRGVVGIANLSEHQGHTGDIFPYLATSYDLNLLRLHLGVTTQSKNEGFFMGIDRTFPFFGGSLQLKADAIQVNEMEDFLYSVGFLYDLKQLHSNKDVSTTGFNKIWQYVINGIIVESWVTIPTATYEEILTLQFNYAIEF